MKPPVFHRITDYDRARLPNAYLAEMDEGVSVLEEWEEKTGKSIGYPAWNLLYYMALCRMDRDTPCLAIETGTNYGFSSIVLGQAMKDTGGGGVVRTVELDPERHALATANIDRAGLAGTVETYCGDALEQLPIMLDDPRPLAVAFLDGNHLYEHVLKEFELVHDRLDEGGVVILDNTYRIADDNGDPRVNGALRKILDRWGGNLVNFPYCSWYTPGMAVWQKNAFEDMSVPAYKGS